MPATGISARRLAAALAAAAAIAAPGVAFSQGTAAEPKAKPGAAKAPAPAKPAAPTAPAAPAAPAAPTDPTGAPQLAARAWILIDPRDGTVLASKASDIPRPIASATKLMTAYVALRKLRPKKVLTAPPYRALAAESLLGLQAGERLTVRDLLYGLILESGNDAAVTLATGVSGSVPEFVEQMNRQAEKLGLSNTSYANPVGLDAPQNYSSATDLAELASELLANPLFAKIADSGTATIQSGNVPRQLTSRNTLLASDPTVDGVKTGHTIGAGYVLVGSATRDGTQLVSAVLGARSEAGRDAETAKLLDYGFSLYEPSQPVEPGEELADPGLDYRDESLALVAKRGVEVSARDGQPVETEVEAPDEVSGAVDEGEALGSVTVTVDGRVADRVPLVAAESVEAATLTDKVISTLANPVILIPLGLFVIVVGLLLASHRRRRSEDEGVLAVSGNGSDPGPPSEQPPSRKARRSKRDRSTPERTPEERREMHEERMRRRQERSTRGGDER